MTATTLAVSYQIPLASVKDTILEVYKSLYFGDNLILSLSFNPTQKFSWLTTGGVDGTPTTTPTATATAPVTSVSATPPIQ